jgi:hypothetical protein
MLMHVGAAGYNAPALLQDASYFGSFSTMLAEELDASLNLHSQGSYAANWGGWNEKWIKGDGNAWYFITPSGGFYEWSGQGMANNRFLAALDPSYYARPDRLHEAAPPAGVQAAAFAQFAAEPVADSIGNSVSYIVAPSKVMDRESKTVIASGRRRVTAESAVDANLVQIAERRDAGAEILHDEAMSRRDLIVGAVEGADSLEWIVNVRAQDTLGSLQSAFSQWNATQR